MESEDATKRVSVPSYAALQSPILGMSTPMQRERSLSDKAHRSAQSQYMIDSGPTYFTRVYETNAPETVLYVEPQGLQRTVPSPRGTMANTTESKPEKQPLIRAARTPLTKNQRFMLIGSIGILVCLVITATVVYFTCLKEPFLTIDSFTRADLLSMKGENELSCLFKLKARNNNLQDIKISHLEVQVCLSELIEPTRPVDDSACLGLAGTHNRIKVDGDTSTLIDIDGRFNITSLPTKVRILQALRSGNFRLKMKGSLFYETFGIIDMDADVDTFIDVPQPVLARQEAEQP
eukprot:TRINITY_DN8785_c0_g1_i1.p1 TRINITY_DN8785_c0_g1~~TRINITY_DN8785_c0_g1_i1.p1  ORF type:complete len:292 (-),score=62.10 TRINITY_DN8785_c0_g1_i1:327-1202(-)